MTPAQVAINHQAITEAANHLERQGYTGDAFALVESIVLAAVAAGYRRIERPVPLKPANVATPDQRRAALDHIRATLTNRETA